MERIGIQYDHPHVMVLKHETEARMNLKLRLFRKAIDEADHGISSAKKTDVTLMLVSLIMRTSILAHCWNGPGGTLIGEQFEARSYIFK